MNREITSKYFQDIEFIANVGYYLIILLTCLSKRKQYSSKNVIMITMYILRNVGDIKIDFIKYLKTHNLFLFLFFFDN